MSRKPTNWDSEKQDDSRDIQQIVDERIHEIDTLLERVSQLYQNYFNGLELKPPVEARGRLEALLHRPLPKMLRTALRFRWEATLARYRMVSGKWDKTLRKIERGTFQKKVLNR